MSQIEIRPGLVEQQESPERLSDERLGNLISAVGNHEAKAILLGLMQPEIIHTRGDLQRLMLHSQGQNPAWRMEKRTPFGYCQKSLAPIGLVAQEVTMKGGLETVGYIKTEYGREIGDVLAGLELNFSLRYPKFSLQDFFSATTSPSRLYEIEGGLEYRKRAPITRLKIFRELLTSPLPIRTIDLSQRLGEPLEMINRHLFYLSEKGIISYESAAQGEPWVYYHLKTDHPQDAPLPYKADNILTQSAYQILWQNPEQKFTRESIMEEYLRIHPEKRNLERSSLQKRLSQILSSLVNQGYAEREKFIGHEKHSEINLTDEQRQILLDLLTILDQFQNQDPEILTYGRRCIQEITADRDKVSLLMRKAREHSYQAQAVPQEQTTATILTIISQNPGITLNQIREILTQQQDRAVGKEIIRQYLQSLLKEGQITQETVRGIRHFSINFNL